MQALNLAYIHTGRHTYTAGHTHTEIQAYIQAYTHRYIHAGAGIHIQKHTRTYIYRHIQASSYIVRHRERQKNGTHT